MVLPIYVLITMLKSSKLDHFSITRVDLENRLETPLLKNCNIRNMTYLVLKWIRKWDTHLPLKSETYQGIHPSQ